jgi:hypothetical protein
MGHSDYRVGVQHALCQSTFMTPPLGWSRCPIKQGWTVDPVTPRRIPCYGSAVQNRAPSFYVTGRGGYMISSPREVRGTIHMIDPEPLGE